MCDDRPVLIRITDRSASHATTMETMATAYSPVVMPADFHGEWFDEDAFLLFSRDARPLLHHAEAQN